MKQTLTLRMERHTECSVCHRQEPHITLLTNTCETCTAAEQYVIPLNRCGPCSVCLAEGDVFQTTLVMDFTGCYTHAVLAGHRAVTQ